MNSSIYKKHDELTRKGRRIQLALNFWTRVATFTRFGLHGFVLWMIRRAYKRAVEFNMIAQAHKRERGDAAKLREAVAYLFTLIDMRKLVLDCDEAEEISAVQVMLDEYRAALSAPPRNCDMPLVVDGPADNNADKAWIVFKRHNPDAYFDVPGLLRCIDWLWLLAATPEKEGGAK